MHLEPPQKSVLPKLIETTDVCLETVCDFPELYSARVTLKPGASYELPVQCFYSLLFGVKENVIFMLNKEKYVIKAGECVFVPAKNCVTLSAPDGGTLLMCAPEKF